MWKGIQNLSRATYNYVTPSSWSAAPKKGTTSQSSSSSTTYQLQKKVAVGATVGAILNKLTPWDIKGYVKRILSAETEEKAVAIFSVILEEDAFATLMSNGRHVLGASDQSTLIKFFAQIAAKYPEYNLYASVTSIIAQLG